MLDVEIYSLLFFSKPKRVTNFVTVLISKEQLLILFDWLKCLDKNIFKYC